MIEVKAYQKHGIKCQELTDEYEFCCWEKLKQWINNPKLTPHQCPKCKEIDEDGN